DFVPRSAIKSQVLVDFVTDWTPSAPSQNPPVIEVIWQLECDGAYCKNGSGASAILTAPSGTQLKYSARLDFPGCTNNVAEYEGLLLGLRKARARLRSRASWAQDSSEEQPWPRGATAGDVTFARRRRYSTASKE